MPGLNTKQAEDTSQGQKKNFCFWSSVNGDLYVARQPSIVDWAPSWESVQVLYHGPQTVCCSLLRDWVLSPLPLNVGSVIAWLIEFGGVIMLCQFPRPDLKKTGSFHVLFLEIITLETQLPSCEKAPNSHMERPCVGVQPAALAEVPAYFQHQPPDMIQMWIRPSFWVFRLRPQASGSRDKLSFCAFPKSWAIEPMSMIKGWWCLHH